MTIAALSIRRTNWEMILTMGTKIPTIENLSEQSTMLLKSMYSEPDMACVLIGTGYLDQALASLLQRFFVNSNIADKMLNPIGGALGTFQSRADISYCLGLIPKSLYKNLCTLGEIRNKFAHSYLALSLDDPEIAELVRSLTFPIFKEVVTSEGRKYNQDYLSSQITHPQQKFKFVVTLMANRLLLDGFSVEHRQRKSGWA
jgi:DNA-binding MltR family transcriptional regulator